MRKQELKPLLLRPATVAKLLDLSPRQLHRLGSKAAAGEAPGFPVPVVLPTMQHRRYRAADVERFVAELAPDGPPGGFTTETSLRRATARQAQRTQRKDG